MEGAGGGNLLISLRYIIIAISNPRESVEPFNVDNVTALKSRRKPSKRIAKSILGASIMYIY